MKTLIDKYIQENKIGIDLSNIAQNYIRDAYIYTNENTDDNVTWSGAIIVNSQDKIISRGANRFAEKIEKNKKRMTKPLMYDVICHAERDAVYNAAKSGLKVEGAALYMTWVPCINCANAIIFSGIERLVTHYDKVIKTTERWNEVVSEALNMILESGIKVDVFKGKIGDVEAKFDGQIWYP